MFKIICMSCLSENVEVCSDRLVCENCGADSLDSPPKINRGVTISAALSDPHPNGAQDCYLRGIYSRGMLNDPEEEAGKEVYIGAYNPDRWSTLEEFVDWRVRNWGFESAYDLWKSEQDN